MNYIIQNKYLTNIQKGIGISIPFNGTTGLNQTFTTKDSTRSNLLNFLLTGSRERILNPNFGSGIRDQIFENISQDNIDNIKDIILYNIKNKFPEVVIEELQIIPDNNTINIYFKYSLINSNITDDIQINFNNG